MFLIAVNQLDRVSQGYAVDVLLRLAAFSPSFCSKPLYLAWGASFENCCEWQSRGKEIVPMRRMVQSVLRTRRIVLGDYQPMTIRKDHVALERKGISLCAYFSSTAVVVAQRLSAKTLWFGWCREPGLDLVLVHPNRQAIEAATGRCGCLFDKHLQLWLAEKQSSATYEIGASSVLTAKVHHGNI